MVPKAAAAGGLFHYKKKNKKKKTFEDFSLSPTREIDTISHTSVALREYT